MSSAEEETVEERFLSRLELVLSLLWDESPIIELGLQNTEILIILTGFM